MKIKRVVLNNFRNYKLSTFDLDQAVTLFHGPNAVGKTSIIEAIYLLSSGNSFRSTKIDEMVSFDTEVSRVSCKLVYTGDDDDDENLEMLLNRGIVQGRRTQKRLYTLNGAKKRKKDFIGKFFSVVFRPEDMRLIEGSKTRRRKFIDEALLVLDWQYARSLKIYEEALLKRNKLLWQIKEKLVPKTTLKYWNMTVLKHGQYIQDSRQKFLNSFISVNYPLDFTIEYQPSIISEDRMEEYGFKEIAAGHSLIGPHKDDFIVSLGQTGQKKKFDVAIYGSRGQQRMAVLWLKVCQLAYIEEQSQQKALLLLDDILSELDEGMKKHVLSLLEGRQSIVTSADDDAKEQLEKYLDEFKSVYLDENDRTKF